MIAGEIYIKHWNENYGTDYGEGQAPHYAIAAMKEYAKNKCEEQRKLCGEFANEYEQIKNGAIPIRIKEDSPEPNFD